MKNLTSLLARLHDEEDGVTATEYIILLILIACFVILIVKLFGSTVSSKFGSAQGAVETQVTF